MTWAMIKDKKKIGTILDEIDDEVQQRNEAEDVLNEQEALEERNEVMKNNEVSEDKENGFPSTEH